MKKCCTYMGWGTKGGCVMCPSLSPLRFNQYAAGPGAEFQPARQLRRVTGRVDEVHAEPPYALQPQVADDLDAVLERLVRGPRGTPEHAEVRRRPALAEVYDQVPGVTERGLGRGRSRHEHANVLPLARRSVLVRRRGLPGIAGDGPERIARQPAPPPALVVDRPRQRPARRPARPDQLGRVAERGHVPDAQVGDQLGV